MSPYFLETSTWFSLQVRTHHSFLPSCLFSLAKFCVSAEKRCESAEPFTSSHREFGLKHGTWLFGKLKQPDSKISDNFPLSFTPFYSCRLRSLSFPHLVVINDHTLIRKAENVCIYVYLEFTIKRQYV